MGRSGLKAKLVRGEEQNDGTIEFEGIFKDETGEELTCKEVVACDKKGKKTCRVVKKEGDPRACRELHRHVKRQDIY